MEDIIGHNFNNDDCYTFIENGIRVNEETISLIDQMEKPNHPNHSINILDELKCIRSKQAVRQDHITQYRSSVMLGSNPFRSIKLG